MKSLITEINHEGLSKCNHSSLVKDLHAWPLVTGLLSECSKHVDFLWWPLVLPPVGIISGLPSVLRNSKWIHTQFRHRVNNQWCLLPKPTAHIQSLLQAYNLFSHSANPFWVCDLSTIGYLLCGQLAINCEKKLTSFFHSFPFFLCVSLHFSLSPLQPSFPWMGITHLFKKKKLKSRVLEHDKLA